MMNNKLGYWNEKTVLLKQLYPNITDNDLQIKEGKEKEIMEMLAYKLGYTPDEMRSIIISL